MPRTVISVRPTEHVLSTIMTIVKTTNVGSVMETVILVNVKKVLSADIIIFM